MKTNKKAVLAKSPANKPAKQVKAKKAKALPITLLGMLYLLLSGARGYALRYGKATKQGDIISFTPCQNNKGLSLQGAEAVTMGPDSIVKGSKTARLCAGTYVNGKSNGAKGKLLTAKQFNALSKPCLVAWNVDSKPYPARYIGNPAEKGMSAVLAGPFAWQMEQDSNSHNKHERGRLLPLTKNGKLTACLPA